MLTTQELEQLQDQIDTNYISEAHYELNLKVRQYIVDWSQNYSDKFQMAAYSAVNGRWDDIKKDVQRERISTDEAVELLNMMLKCRLITKRFHEQFKANLC